MSDQRNLSAPGFILRHRMMFTAACWGFFVAEVLGGWSWRWWALSLGAFIVYEIGRSERG